jgi:hypothetical protein
MIQGCGMEPDDHVEYAPTTVVSIDSIEFKSRHATFYVVCSSACYYDTFGTYALRYTTDTIYVDIHSQRSGLCLPAFAYYAVTLPIPVAHGGTYTIQFSSAYEGPLDTTIVIPD